MTGMFRFGVVEGFAADAKSWTGAAQRAERLGYSSFLMPDTAWTLSPFVALTAAASATSTLFVGTHVLAAPFRTPAMVAADTVSLDLLSDGRFELGLGIGRPDARAETERIGMPWRSGHERLLLVAETIAQVRQRFAEQKRPAPPVMLAGSGPKLFELATAEADILTLALPPRTSQEQLAVKVGELQAIAGARFDDIELAINLFAVGDELPPWLAQRMGVDLPSLRATDSYAQLTGTPQQMADVLLRRRDRLGISYVTVAGVFAENFAPVVELLAGR